MITFKRVLVLCALALIEALPTRATFERLQSVLATDADVGVLGPDDSVHGTTVPSVVQVAASSTEPTQCPRITQPPSGHLRSARPRHFAAPPSRQPVDLQPSHSPNSLSPCPNPHPCCQPEAPAGFRTYPCGLGSCFAAPLPPHPAVQPAPQPETPPAIH